jgi:hypothetical protein
LVVKGYDALDESEQEDFSTACEKRGLSPSDFTVSIEEKYPAVGVGHIHRIVHVAKCGRKEGRSYPAGSGTAWNYAFEQDLLAGKFD